MLRFSLEPVAAGVIAKGSLHTAARNNRKRQGVIVREGSEHRPGANQKIKYPDKTGCYRIRFFSDHPVSSLYKDNS